MSKEEEKTTNGIANKGKGIIKEFKEFIARGNVIDLAVGVIIGTAFSKIVTSLTDNILMPIIGVIIGNLDFSSLAIKVNLFDRIVAIRYGLFINDVVNFLLTALCIFIVVKVMNKIMAKRKKEEKPAPAPVKSDEVKLLEEIRDLLKKSK